jgi:hypothetical protein
MFADEPSICGALNLAGRIVSTRFGVISILLGIVWILQAFDMAFNSQTMPQCLPIAGERELRPQDTGSVSQRDSNPMWFPGQCGRVPVHPGRPGSVRTA